MLKNFESGYWYVLYVRSRQERKVHQLLLEQEMESFLPIVKTISQWSDRKKTILKPLFPSYVFVKINSSKEFVKPLDIDGACDYIRFGREYAKVQEKEIENIRLFLQADGISDVRATSEVFKTGEIRKINFGALSGLECEILRCNNERKVLVRLESLHQNVIATLPVSYFQEANDMAMV